MGRIQRLQGPEPYLVAEVQASPFYKELWEQFVAFVRGCAKDHGWTHFSLKMELSLHRTIVENVVHFHVAVTDPDKVHRFGSKRPWLFHGATPHVRGAKGRGRHLVRALNNAHYYTQAPKLGSVFVDTNWTRFTDFPVEASSVMALWRLYKMTHETAKTELWRGRVRGVRGHTAEIEWVEAADRKERDEAGPKNLQEKSWPRGPACNAGGRVPAFARAADLHPRGGRVDAALLRPVRSQGPLPFPGLARGVDVWQDQLCQAPLRPREDPGRELPECAAAQPQGQPHITLKI